MIRTDGKYNTDYGIIDIYKFYKKAQKEKDLPIIELPIFRKIIKYYNIETCKGIVENSNEFRLPFRLGYLRIRKFKTRIISDANGKLKTGHMHPDWKATKALWLTNPKAKEDKKIVWHTNNHSQGYYYKWYWDKRACNITNSSVYSLTMSRNNKRLISKIVKTKDHIDYYE